MKIKGLTVRARVIMSFAAGIFALLVAGLVIHIARGYLTAKTPANPTASSTINTAPPAYDFKVLYTDTGFIPSLLDIPIGSRVAFENDTAAPLLVASDPNPTHTDYPEFVAGRDYEPGETYIFQFEKAGTFGYGNDKKISDHAFVHVTDPNNPLLSIDNVPVAQQAERDKLVAMLLPGDPDSIFTVFDAISANPSLAANCHEIGHDLGHRAYELFGFSGAMTFSNPERTSHVAVEDICSGGYMHGILEELFSYQPELKNTPGIMCANVPEENQASCYHGVGHGLMFVYQRNVSSSLTGCRTLPTSEDTYRCFEGVWMELFWGETDHSGPNSLYWDLNQPLAPCIAATTDEKPTCFLYSSFGYLRANPEDYTGAVHLCVDSGLPESDAEFCLQGLGITMLSHFGGKHLERSEPFVAGLSDAQKKSFYTGVIGYGAFSGISVSDLTYTCNLLINDKDVCLAVLAKH